MLVITRRYNEDEWPVGMENWGELTGAPGSWTVLSIPSFCAVFGQHRFAGYPTTSLIFCLNDLLETSFSEYYWFLKDRNSWVQLDFCPFYVFFFYGFVSKAAYLGSILGASQGPALGWYPIVEPTEKLPSYLVDIRHVKPMFASFRPNVLGESCILTNMG